jgi:hypothetical protein
MRIRLRSGDVADSEVIGLVVVDVRQATNSKQDAASSEQETTLAARCPLRAVRFI